jgi:hypothetical protein
VGCNRKNIGNKKRSISIVTEQFNSEESLMYSQLFAFILFSLVGFSHNVLCENELDNFLFLPLDDSLTLEIRPTEEDLKIYLNFLSRIHFIENSILNDDGSVSFYWPTYMGALINYYRADARPLNRLDLCQFLLPGMDIDEKASVARALGSEWYSTKFKLEDAEYRTYTIDTEQRSKIIKGPQSIPSHIIQFARCVPNGTPPKSRRYESIVINTEQNTALITAPQFIYEGERYYFSSYSDLVGICKLFGQKGIKKVSYGQTFWAQKFVRLDEQAYFAEIIGNKTSYITGIECYY